MKTQLQYKFPRISFQTDSEILELLLHSSFASQLQYKNRL